LVIIAPCKIETRRSVAAEELLRQYLLPYKDIIDLEVDETKGDLARLCKEDCPSCSWENPHGIALSESIAYFKRTLDKSGKIKLSVRKFRDRGMLKPALPKSKARKICQSSEREKESPNEVSAPPERDKPIDERTPSPSPPSYELVEVTANYIDELCDNAVLRLANEVVAMFRYGKQDEIEQVSDAIHTVKVVASWHYG
jgi:hypothetical protein